MKKIFSLLRQKLDYVKGKENTENDSVAVTTTIDPEELKYSYLSPREQAEYIAQKAADHVVGQPQLDLNDSPLSCGPITLDIRQAWLQYNDGKKISISPDNHEIRLLQLLLQSDKVVFYIAIVRELKLPHSNSSNLKNDDMSIKRDAQEVMRKLKRRLRELDMSDQEIGNIIKPVKNQGYVARCS